VARFLELSKVYADTNDWWGLAGPEAALMAAGQGAEVVLYEMRPERQTTARERAPLERDEGVFVIFIPL
jgi:hypothetical protein